MSDKKPDDANVKNELPDIADFLAKNRWKVKQLTRYVQALIWCKDDLKGIEWVTFRMACHNLCKELYILLEQGESDAGAQHTWRKINSSTTGEKHEREI